MHTRDASRRRHDAQFKARVLAACGEPGASVAAVARAHDLNANLVHKWRRGRGARPLSSPTDAAAPEFAALPSAPAAAPAVQVVTGTANLPARQPAQRALADAAGPFVPVQLAMPRATPADIRLELHRGAATVIVSWPAREAAACGRWLREWLG